MIRAATPQEMEEVGKVYRAVWNETQAALQPPAVREFRTRQYFYRRVSSRDHLPLVAIRGDAIAGFAAYQNNTIDQLFVLSSARGQGFGHRLLSACEDHIASLGFTSAVLHCLVGNDLARRFYERHGWALGRTIVERVDVTGGSVDVPVWEMVRLLKE